ncbi:MAG: sigma 54-interacting transcriptional regulator, partial [Thermoanaerobaculia bacterium]|nr:sigma 54-interacting transcriptional regulator [Thermoanaerobaculia bacterium]
MRARGVLGRHARISVAGEELRLEVLGSAPGSDVTLNGSIVKSAALAAGDRIAIGEATITLLNGPAPNPHRMAAPPPRGRDALSLATAALAPLAPGPAPAPSVGAAPGAVAARPVPVPGPRPAAAPAEGRPEERAVSDPWSGFFECLHRPVPFEDLLQEIAAYIASSTPVHSLAFVSLLPPNEGEAIAALWKGTLPRLSARTLAEARGKTSSWEALEAGARLRVFPVPRPGGDPVGLLLVPVETVTDPALLDFMAHAASAIGFVHGERSEAAFGERGASSAPASSGVSLEDPLAKLVGGSLPLSNLKASLSRVASARAPILLVGDVGSGKTLVAETLHALSPRRGRPLVRVSATASSALALEEDLLGAPAAGDRRRRVGRLFDADGGTLLVEEVGDLPAPTQA